MESLQRLTDHIHGGFERIFHNRRFKSYKIKIMELARNVTMDIEEQLDKYTGVMIGTKHKKIEKVSEFSNVDDRTIAYFKDRNHRETTENQPIPPLKRFRNCVNTVIAILNHIKAMRIQYVETEGADLFYIRLLSVANGNIAKELDYYVVDKAANLENLPDVKLPDQDSVQCSSSGTKISQKDKKSKVITFDDTCTSPNTPRVERNSPSTKKIGSERRKSESVDVNAWITGKLTSYDFLSQARQLKANDEDDSEESSYEEESSEESEDISVASSGRGMYDSDDGKEDIDDVTWGQHNNENENDMNVQLKLNYNNRKEIMEITVETVNNIKLPEKSKSAINKARIHVNMYPKISNNIRTKPYKILEESVEIGETLSFSKVPLIDIHKLVLRLQLYGIIKKFLRKKKVLLAQTLIPVSSMDHEMRELQTFVFKQIAAEEMMNPLLRRNSKFIPDLTVSINYSHYSSQIIVEILKGTLLQGIAVSDDFSTFIVAQFINKEGKIIHECKTKEIQNQYEPMYHERFAYKTKFSDLKELSLVLSAYKHQKKHKTTLIGSCSLGYASSSTDAIQQWNELINTNGDVVTSIIELVL